MSRVLTPARPAPAFDRIGVRLLALGREVVAAVRLVPATTLPAFAPARAIPLRGTSGSPRMARADAAWLDAAAGCEFVDDLIRHAE
jgi:hypothetical protein